MLGFPCYQMPLPVRPPQPFLFAPPSMSEVSYSEERPLLVPSASAWPSYASTSGPPSNQDYPDEFAGVCPDSQMEMLPPSLYQLHEEEIGKLDVIISCN